MYDIVHSVLHLCNGHKTLGLVWRSWHPAHSTLVIKQPRQGSQIQKLILQTQIQIP